MSTMKPTATKRKTAAVSVESQGAQPPKARARAGKKLVLSVAPPPKEPSRTERKRAERMQRILEVAAEVFSERGYRDASLEQIAARLDMRGPSIYHYFPTKEELYARCLESLNAGIFEKLKAIAQTDAPAIERLRAMFRQQVLSQLRDYYPQYIPLTIATQFAGGILPDSVKEGRAYHIGLFRKVAEEAARAGHLPRADWRLGMRLAFGALGFLHSWYRPDGKKTPEQLSDEIAEALMRLLGARSAAR